MFTTEKHWGIERLVDRAARVNPDQAQPWTVYARVLARIRAAVRRGSPETNESIVVTTCDVTLDMSERLATDRAGRGVRLTPTEWRLLEALAR